MVWKLTFRWFMSRSVKNRWSRKEKDVRQAVFIAVPPTDYPAA